MPPLSVLGRGGYPVPGYTSGTPDQRYGPAPAPGSLFDPARIEEAYQQGLIPGSPGYEAAVRQNPGIDPQTGQPWRATDQGGWGGGAGAGGDDWFSQQGAPGGTPGGTPAGSGDASWWNPADPRGSLNTLFGGQPPSSQTILAHAPQLQAAGIEISPPNAEGVTSKIHIPGVGWTRILEGGVAGGAGTGWNYVPQGVTGPGGTQNLDGSPAGGGGNPLGSGYLGLDPMAAFRLGHEGLQMDPGYQFRLQEGQKAIERSAAAKGTLLTGGTLKGLTRYGQDYASGEFQNRYNRLFGEQQNRYNQLMGYTGLGQASAAGQAASNSAYANAAGNQITDIGNAQVAGTVGGANAVTGAINQGANTALQMWYLSQLGRGGGGAGGGTLPPHLGG